VVKKCVVQSVGSKWSSSDVWLVKQHNRWSLTHKICCEQCRAAAVLIAVQNCTTADAVRDVRLCDAVIHTISLKYAV
jgi:hypothetical protein